MAFIDYKFWFIKRDDDGYITECAIRFYEGEPKDVQLEDVVTKEKKTVNKYIRSRRLGEDDMKAFKGETKHEMSGLPVRLYTDLGKIKTNEELCEFLNKELSNHPTLEAVDAQKIKKDKEVKK